MHSRHMHTRLFHARSRPFARRLCVSQANAKIRMFCSLGFYPHMDAQEVNTTLYNIINRTTQQLSHLRNLFRRLKSWNHLVQHNTQTVANSSHGTQFSRALACLSRLGLIPQSEMNLTYPGCQRLFSRVRPTHEHSVSYFLKRHCEKSLRLPFWPDYLSTKAREINFWYPG